MKKWFLLRITNLINNYLKRDVALQFKLQRLKNKSLAIELLPLHLTLIILFNEESVAIIDDARVSQAKLTGSPLQLLNLLLHKKNRQQFFKEDIVLEGDIEFANEVMVFFDTFQIDWEEELSQVMGDVSAHQTMQWLKRIRQVAKNFSQSFSEDVSEYVHEEINCFPSSQALNDFFAEVDTLRIDVDRTEVKIQHLIAAMMIDPKEAL